ncbi:MAG: hypothetical protein R3A10_17910 [Caldilineaceae bacterium]
MRRINPYYTPPGCWTTPGLIVFVGVDQSAAWPARPPHRHQLALRSSTTRAGTHSPWHLSPRRNSTWSSTSTKTRCGAWRRRGSDGAARPAGCVSGNCGHLKGSGGHGPALQRNGVRLWTVNRAWQP